MNNYLNCLKNIRTCNVCGGDNCRYGAIIENIVNGDPVNNINDLRFGWRNMPALLHAIVYGRTEFVELLLNQGADPNMRYYYGETPLHRAVLTCDTLKMIELLICHGADINAQDDDGFTPLHSAATAMILPDISIVEILLAHGADPSIPNDMGRLPRDTARTDEISDFLASYTGAKTKSAE